MKVVLLAQRPQRNDCDAAIFGVQHIRDAILSTGAQSGIPPAGAGFDGVVLINTTIGADQFTGTGFLLPDGRHILTAAHKFTTTGTGTIGITTPVPVSFDLSTAGRINIEVPIANIVLNAGYTGGNENWTGTTGQQNNVDLTKRMARNRQGFLGGVFVGGRG